jgi:putative flippase GtrA
VAVQSALSDWLVFTVIVGVGGDETVAQGVGRLVGGVVSFVANKLWAFGAHDGRLGQEARRFLALYAFAYVLSLGLFVGLHDGLGAWPWLAKGVADVTCFAVNFVVMRAWVFASGAKRLGETREPDAGPGEDLR